MNININDLHDSEYIFQDIPIEVDCQLNQAECL